MSAEHDRAALTQALRRQVDELSAELSRTRAANRTQAGELAGLLAALQVRVEDVEEALAESPDRRRPPPPVSWLAPDGPDTPPQTLGELVGWLERVYLHFAPLPVCWLRHPGAIDKLLALAQAHWRAYHGPEASVAYAIHWHTRDQPDTTTWIDKHGRACPAAHRHATHPTGRPEPPLAAFADQIETAWTAHHEMPAPGEDEIAAATQLATDHRR
jgi:uncharacterized coiled-coil protein SlyX